MEPAGVRDLAGEFAREAKSGGSHFDPPANGVFSWSSVKGRFYFNCGEIVGVKFQPARFRQIPRIKNATPVLEAPCARAYANFLLIGEIQRKSKISQFVPWEKPSHCEM